MNKKIQNAIGIGLSALLFVLAGAFLVYPAVTQISGLAVAQSNIKWNNVKDAAAGDNLTTGILAMSLYMFDGTNHDRLRGDTTNGIDVDVTRVQGTVAATKTVVTNFFAVKRDDITTSSVNLAFGFTARKIAIEMPSANTAEVCVDWNGTTAVCPAANTAGDDRITAGTQLIIDDIAETSISVIAASGTQTVFVRAWQ